MGNAVRVLVIVCAVCVAVIAAAGNGWYWWRVNAGSIEAQIIGVAFSGAAGALKIGVPVHIAAQQLRWRQRPKLIFVALLALVFDAWSGLGYVGLIRDDAAAMRRVAGRAATDAALEVPRLEAALAAMGAARKPSEYYPPQIAVQETVAGACPAVRSPSDPCRILAALRAEYGAAKSRESIEAQLSAARALAGTALASEARPEVMPVVKALASFGVPATPDVMAAIWSALMLIFVELVPVAVMAETLRRPEAKPIEVVAAPVPRARAPVAPPAITTGAVDIVAAVASLPSDLDGWRRAPLRQLSGLTKTSATTAGRALKAAVASGQLEMQQTKTGSRVRVVTS